MGTIYGEGFVADRKKPTKRERLRAMALLQAYLQFHATKFSREDREQGCWTLLFVWARHGGNHQRDVVGSALGDGVQGGGE